MFVNGMVGGYGTLMSDGNPTAARATAQNVLGNIGRAVGGFGRWRSALAARYSFQTGIALLAGLYMLDMVATLFVIPELKGVELE
ncbi:major facilitator superfamily MFS_1 [Burkholderia ambifaria AMMD]|uniref:Major facilitator superfamily, (MFS_1) family n=1 Tax=Burkholderia ambifaria (strain ATCC BAA-244 / DSM 16087 / CCUG 44356 / LMG 19182 / AMMD) TaxID=339670 RepID=Q0B2I9_BURCM|nr:major facilitator superfamily, (MFS_1) family [Burkholderia ambifaria AMMD]AJY26855.1 major facilitator superfamily MFS_1 [Burkholderia ambifaria AMMD]PEH70480.1 MFS transporter [Burkholderia ambifaria]